MAGYFGPPLRRRQPPTRPSAGHRHRPTTTQGPNLMRTELPAYRSALAVAVLAPLAACGGTESTPPPPPPPAVTTVEVTPATPSVAAGDSVQLAVAVKDQN